MDDSRKEKAMSKRGTAQVVMLPRDPEMAYVYWEWPGASSPNETGQLTVYVKGEVERHLVGSFDISEECGGRFVPFGRPGAIHICELQWGEDSLQSAPVGAPRRESGDKKPRFVRLQLTEKGSQTEPAEHEHAIRGRFPAAASDSPSSRGHSDNSSSREHSDTSSSKGHSRDHITR